MRNKRHQVGLERREQFGHEAAGLGGGAGASLAPLTPLTPLALTALPV